MYNPGDLAVIEEDEGGCTDMRSNYASVKRSSCVHLPHSCGWWIVGGPEQVRAMIADLQAALAKMGEADG